MRTLVHGSINKFLKAAKGSKQGASTSKFLPFTLVELKCHIENLFEPWMTWKNHGRYDPETWDDDNSKTWTWQLDHIIPHSDLAYDSLEHSNFQKCWALENLRPYSSKDNILDGSNKVRHKSKLNNE